jgi:hypothetical protein
MSVTAVAKDPRRPVPPGTLIGTAPPTAPPHGSARERARRWAAWFETLSEEQQQRVLSELRTAEA